MSITIATHNGSAVRRAHNIRDKRVVEKQKHIDPDGCHEIWKDETVAHAYHRIFDEAVAKYNLTQDRPERRIKNYLSQIEKDAKKHSCYEMIIGIYPYKDPETGLKDPSPDPEIGKEILRAFVDGWAHRNPNLELIGAYYHADEEGEQPHVHLDYIPVATDYAKGLEKQSAMRKALEQMGFVKSGKTTSQILWEACENAFLEELCEKKGMTVMHPKEDRAHEDTETYKRRMEFERYKRLEVEISETEVKESGAFGKVVVDKQDFDRLKEQAKSYIANKEEIATVRSDKARNAKAEAAIRKKKEELSKREQALAAREKSADVQTLQRAYAQTAKALEREKAERARFETRVKELEGENNTLKNDLGAWKSFAETLLRVLAWIVKELFKIDLKGLRPHDRRIVEETRSSALGTLEERTDDPQYYLDRALPPERANTDREYND